MTEQTDREPVFYWDVIEALENVIKAADPEKRAALVTAIDAWSEDFQDEYLWAFGPQSPTFLHQLLMGIDCAVRDKGDGKTRVIRLVDRKPEGRA